MGWHPDYRTALVTGASRGIGAAIAARLVAGGLRVHGVARNAEALAALQAELGDAFVPTPADVTDTAAVLTAVEGAEIDVLVNNAGGLATVRPLFEQTAEETAQVVALNLVAPLQLMQGLLPGMIARGRGHVINMTTTAARAVFAGTTVYAAAKAGLSHASRVARYDLVGTRVRITDVAPGRVETEFYLESFSGDRTALSKTLYTQERALRAADVAEVVWGALSLPPHADVAELVLSPTDQATGGHSYARLAGGS